MNKSRQPKIKSISEDPFEKILADQAKWESQWESMSEDERVYWNKVRLQEMFDRQERKDKEKEYQEQIYNSKKVSPLVESIEKHSTLTKIIFWGGLILIMLGLMMWRDTKSTSYDLNGYSETRNSYSCLMYELDKDELTRIALMKGIDVSGLSEESLAEILDLPQCKDICIDQLKYSSEYPDEWFADDDLRTICRAVGITLPK